MKEFFLKYQREVIFFVMLVLVSVVSFEVGVLYAGDNQKLASNESVIVIEKPMSDPALIANHVDTPTPESEAQVLGVDTVQGNLQGDCLFVGSKNSDKYHSPTCHWAERIKSENKVCFTSVEDAIKKGYEEGCIE